MVDLELFLHKRSIIEARTKKNNKEPQEIQRIFPREKTEFNKSKQYNSTSQLH